MSVAFILFGVVMALGGKASNSGKYFALWWVPGAAAASGVIMRDGVTFAVGGLCFLLAGAVFLVENRRAQAERANQARGRRSRRDAEHTTTGLPHRNYRRKRAS